MEDRHPRLRIGLNSVSNESAALAEPNGRLGHIALIERRHDVRQSAHGLIASNDAGLEIIKNMPDESGHVFVIFFCQNITRIYFVAHLIAHETPALSREGRALECWISEAPGQTCSRP